MAGAFRSEFGTNGLCLSGGFVTGNLFGTFLNLFRSVLVWDGAIMMVSLVAIEGLNWLSFRPGGEPDSGRGTRFFKLGLLLGTFTDAFKVGS